MIFGRLNAATGRLSDIADRDAQFPEDVPLDRMPQGFGPFVYDAANRSAVGDVLNADEKAGRRGTSLALAALLVRASSTATAAQKVRAQAIIDAAAAQVLDLLA